VLPKPRKERNIIIRNQLGQIVASKPFGLGAYTHI